MKNIEGTYFDSVFHTENMRQMTLGQYIDKVRSHEFASQITRLRELMKAGKKQEAVEYKKKLPLFVVGGVMKGGRRLEHLLHYSQCLCIDIDNSPVSPEEIRRIAEKLSYVKAGHVSPSGTGYKLFVTVDSSLAQHAQAFETVRCRLEKEIPGIQVDISGKDANRGCFVSHDPLAFMKEETECLKISTAEAESVGKNKLKKSALELYISKFERNNAFLDGQRHLFIVKLAAQLNHAGFPLDEVVEECRRRYSSTDFSIGEIEKTVRDIYTRYRTSHATQPYAPKEERDSEKSSKSSKNSYSISEKNTPSDEEDEEADIELNESLLPPLQQGHLRPTSGHPFGHVEAGEKPRRTGHYATGWNGSIQQRDEQRQRLFGKTRTLPLLLCRRHRTLRKWERMCRSHAQDGGTLAAARLRRVPSAGQGV